MGKKELIEKVFMAFERQMSDRMEEVFNAIQVEVEQGEKPIDEILEKRFFELYDKLTTSSKLVQYVVEDAVEEDDDDDVDDESTDAE